MVKKLLLLCWLLLNLIACSSGLIVLENGTEFENVDAGIFYQEYNVTSNFIKIDFSDNCKVSNNNDGQSFDGKIILVIWDEAEANGCWKISQVIDQTDAIYQPEVSIVTSRYSDLNHYELFNVYHEDFNEILHPFQSDVTLITNETVHQLLTLPKNISMTITSSLISFHFIFH